MSKELVSKEETGLLDTSDLFMMGNEEASAQDIILSRILLMQGTSKWVPDQFAIGDIISSADEELVAGKGETIKIIPFKLTKTWVVSTDGPESRWVRNEPWTDSNDRAEWKFQGEDREGQVTDLKRMKNFGFYCFVVTEDGIQAHDLPMMIDFRSSAGKDGRKLASHFGIMKGIGQPGCTVAWDLGAETVKDGGKSYQKYTLRKAGNTLPADFEVIKKWLTLMNDESSNVSTQSESEY